MLSVIQDIRHGLRTLAGHPGLTLVAALSLGLGIGAQTSVYSLIDALFLRAPAGVADGSRLVAISALTRGVPDEDTIRYRDYLYYRDRNTVFTELASHFNSGITLADTEHADALDAYVVSANYFSALGLRPHVGRFFRSDEDVVPARSPVVVLSHSFWRRRFAADPGCVGAVLKLNGTSFTIVGVGPSGFEGTKAGWPVDVFVPNMMAHVGSPGLDILSRDSARLDLVGRLEPGSTIEQARAEMTGLARQLEIDRAESGDGSGLFLSWFKGIHPEARPAAARLVRLLAAAATCLVVIACANLAGLLLARNTTRHKEIAIRLALGAGRGRLVQQLLTETMLLAIIGGLLGLIVASWGNIVLSNNYSTEIDGVRHSYALTIDRTAFLLTMLVAMATGVGAGLVPATVASRTALRSALTKDASSQGFRRSPLRAVFLVAQIALSVVLLIGAVLLMQSVRTLRDPGFDAEDVAYFRMRPRLSGYDRASAADYFREVQRRIEALGAVEALAFVRFPPTLAPSTVPVSLRDHAQAGPAEAFRVSLHLVAAGYFETLRIPIVRGRGFDDRDSEAGRQSVVVNEVLAGRLWPHADPIGQTLFVQEKAHEVVGVARYRGLRPAGFADQPFLFRADWASAAESGRLLVRVKDDLRMMLPLLRSEITTVDPSVTISEELPLRRLLENMYAEVPLALLVLTCAGGLALLLTAIGLYGVLALAVGQRTREIGIRMAIGARVPSILGLILREGMSIALLGLAIGLVSAAFLSRLLARFLFGTTSSDPTTYIAAAVLFGTVALVACFLPAWRAARIDPLVALRGE